MIMWGSVIHISIASAFALLYLVPDKIKALDLTSLINNNYEFISVINQLEAQNFCFTISLFHASTCFEHMCSKHVEA